VTVVGVLIGIAIFLILAYLALMLLLIPYFWFKAYLESEESKLQRNRDSYQKKLQEFQNQDGVIDSLLTPFKESQRKGLAKFTQNEIIVESFEWLLSWGVFLVIEGMWAFSLYNGFDFIMQNVGDFLDENFFAEYS
jgi:hypothetical protein